MNASKPFYLSSGFIISTLGLILTVVMSVMDKLPPEVTAYVMAGIGGFYIMARAVGKIGESHDSSKKPFWKTSEFYVATLGAAISVVTWLGDVLPAETATKVLGTLTMVYTMARRVSKVGDPIETVQNRKLNEVLDELKKNAGKAAMILLLCTGAVGMTGCSLLGAQAEPIPFATYVQYFDPVEGEALRLHELIDQAEAKGVISETKARSMRNRLDAQTELTDELSSGKYKTIDVTAEKPAITESN